MCCIKRGQLHVGASSGGVPLDESIQAVAHVSPFVESKALEHARRLLTQMRRDLSPLLREILVACHVCEALRTGVDHNEERYIRREWLPVTTLVLDFAFLHFRD